jgi:methionine-rich copper-binding protein CopC
MMKPARRRPARRRASVLAIGQAPRPRRRAALALRVEALEPRNLLSGPGSTLAEMEPNDTLDVAQSLGALGGLGAAEAVGTIGNGPSGAADVDWYRFRLDRTAMVTLTTAALPGGPAFRGVLSLYNDDPHDVGDPYDPMGHRLLAQGDGGVPGGVDTIVRLLGPGTYEVAVSGAGNLNFNPFLAGSGTPGATGDYALLADAVEAGPGPGDGPAVLTTDPAPGAVLVASPLTIRLDLSGPLDPSSVVAGQTVRLIFNPNGTFGDGHDRSVALSGTNVSASADELQLTPGAPLSPGYYKVVLAGYDGSGQAVVTGTDSRPLGEDLLHPSGRDYSFTFHVDGIDGVAGATARDDTPATARDLGDVVGAGVVQVAGAIGDAPASDPNVPANPANDADLYHFHVSGPGRFAFIAEVFAGRVGSPLTPGLSLYRLDRVSHTLQFVDGNIGTQNATAATDHSLPLYSDPALFAGLTEGDYYLAVADGPNTPSPLQSQQPGSPGLYDPDVPGSGTLGINTGPYVLNLLVQPDSTPPQVEATSPAAGAPLAQPPTQLTVQFSEPVNLQFLAYEASQLSAGQPSAPDFIPSVYVQGPDGTQYHPEFVSFDDQTDVATFQMADDLPDGVYQLHLSGSAGLSDFAGNPLAGNDPGGDYVVTFRVDDPSRGQGDPRQRTDQEPNDDPAHAQDLGVFFAHDLRDGITVTRDPAADPALARSDTADIYRFQLVQARPQWFTFSLQGTGLPAGTQLTLLDADGHPVPLTSLPRGKGLRGLLGAGTYLISVTGWTPAQAAGVGYHLLISSPSQAGDPPPLVAGPSPALAIRLVGDPPPSADATPNTVLAGTGPAAESPAPAVELSAPAVVSSTPAAGSSAPAVGSSAPADGGATITTVAAASTAVVSAPAAVAPAPAVVAGASAPRASAPGNPAPGFATPADLVVLGVGPVGGVTGAGVQNAAAPGQVALQMTAAPIAQGMIGLVTLTQHIDGDGEVPGPASVRSQAEEPIAAAVAAEAEGSDRGPSQSGGDAGVAARVVAGPVQSPLTMGGPAALPTDAGATVGGGEGVVEAGSPALAGDVAGASDGPALGLALAGPPWASALAALAAAALACVAKRRLGRWRREEARAARGPRPALSIPHAFRATRTVRGRREGRGAAASGRA